MSESAAVLAANTTFYRAFAAPDMAAMDELWASSLPVTCVHPGWDTLAGRDQVMESWRGILLGAGPPPIRCCNETAYVHGDLAYVMCHEVIARNQLVAINVFAREDGAWKMIHHQASPMAPGVERQEPPAAPTSRRLH
ncbi:MAG: DUF4440 domain-containing protein [Alphaproteobacteria bacterium]|nr:DUF4440 domain-containing protein [Alphaproteobacteria bacterium]